VHRQTDSIFPGEVDAQRFDAQLAWLTGLFNVLPLDEAIERLRDGTLPPRAACITFDDGYADNAEVALPILKRHNATATFFISTGFLDGGRMWNDTIIESVRRAPGNMLDLSSLGLGRHDISDPAARRRAIGAILGSIKYLAHAERLEQVAAVERNIGEPLPNDLMMRSEQVRLLADSGMTIGAHTVSHPILARLPTAEARQEIASSRETLKAITGRPITLFAYPNGKPTEDYLLEHVAMVRELGFSGAVSTAWGAASMSDDFFQLPRFLPWDRTAMRFSLRLTSNLLRSASTLPRQI